MSQCREDQSHRREDIKDEKWPDGNSCLEEGLGGLSDVAMYECLVQIIWI